MRAAPPLPDRKKCKVAAESLLVGNSKVGFLKFRHGLQRHSGEDALTPIPLLFMGILLGNKSHGLRSEHFREDAYWAEVDMILLSNLRETLELQREAESFLAAGRKEEKLAMQSRTRCESGIS
jgi:hypothetical protein